MAYQLKAMAALSEDLSLVPRLHIGHLVTPTSGDVTLSSHLCGNYIHLVHVHVYTHTQIEVKLSLENKTTIWNTAFLPLIEDEIKSTFYFDICVYFYLKNEIFPEYLILQDIEHLHHLSHIFIL